MKKTILRHKAVLHIPQQAWDDGRLTDLDLTAEMAELMAALEAAGVTSLYRTKVTGSYHGRSYPELLLTIFGAAETAAGTEIFVRWNEAHRDALRQEAFAYELDGELFVFQF